MTDTLNELLSGDVNCISCGLAHPLGEHLNREALQKAMDAYEECFPDAQGIDYDGLKAGIATYLAALPGEIRGNTDDCLSAKLSELAKAIQVWDGETPAALLLFEAADKLSARKRESGEHAKTKDFVNLIRMKLERRFQVSDYLQDGFQEDPPTRAVVTDICQDVMAHVKEIHALAERLLNSIGG